MDWANFRGRRRRPTTCPSVGLLCANAERRKAALEGCGKTGSWGEEDQLGRERPEIDEWPKFYTIIWIQRQFRTKSWQL
jgi:hypothetical protein